MLGNLQLVNVCVAGTLLLGLIEPCYSLYCNTCKTDRPTCKNAADYYKEECAYDVVYCLKADGTHETHNGQTGNITKVTGIWRSCGDPDVARVLFEEPDVKKHVHGCTEKANVKTELPIHGSLAKKTLSYAGTVCLCSGDSCNGSYQVKYSMYSTASVLLTSLTCIYIPNSKLKM